MQFYLNVLTYLFKYNYNIQILNSTNYRLKKLWFIIFDHTINSLSTFKINLKNNNSMTGSITSNLKKNVTEQFYRITNSSKLFQKLT